MRVEGHCVGCLGKVWGTFLHGGYGEVLFGRGLGARRKQFYCSAIGSESGDGDGNGNGDRSLLREWWVRVTTGHDMLGGWEGLDVLEVAEALKTVVAKYFGDGGYVNIGRGRGSGTGGALGRRNRRGGRGRGRGGGGSFTSQHTQDDDDGRFWYFTGDAEVKRDRDFVVDFVRVVGRKERKKRKIWSDLSNSTSTWAGPSQSHSPNEMDVDEVADDDVHDEDAGNNTSSDTDDDDNDDDDDHHHHHQQQPPGPFPLSFPSNPSYTHLPSVRETTRSTTRFHHDRPGEADRIIEMMGRVQPFFMADGDINNGNGESVADRGRAEWWVVNEDVRRVYAAGKKGKAKGKGRGGGKDWFIRDEVWVGCLFR